MNFFPYDSIEMPRGTGGIIADDKRSLSAFWNAVDEVCGYQISTACGCYVFSIRAGRGVLPWYVGKAEKQSFRAECFAAHKLNIYNKVLANRKGGTPLLTFVAKHTPNWAIVSPRGSNQKDIQFLEDFLIASAIQRNPRLVNIRSTKMLKDMIVHGVLNTPQGKQRESVRAFRELMGT